LVTNRRYHHQKWHYLISTDLTLSPHTILSYYLVRWEVENFYRAAKQLLGWGDYQMHRLVAIERHVLLMMVTHAYLELQRQDLSEQVADGNLHVTLGDLQRLQQAAVQWQPLRSFLRSLSADMTWKPSMNVSPHKSA
jgi:hypothetical protein